MTTCKFITEENHALKTHQFFIPDGILDMLRGIQRRYEESGMSLDVAGYKRLVGLTDDPSIGYDEMRRLKNFFDNYHGSKRETTYILNGGDAMKTWVETALDNAIKSVNDSASAPARPYQRKTVGNGMSIGQTPGKNLQRRLT